MTTTEATIKPAQGAKQLLDYMKAEGLDTLDKENVTTFLDDLGVSPRSRGLTLGYGTRQRWWSVVQGSIKLGSGKNGATADQGPDALPALESSEADLRDMAIRLGIAADRSAATAYHLSATRDLGSPRAFAAGLANCPLNPGERSRLYSTWFSAAGIEAPAYGDVGATGDDPTSSPKRKQSFMAVGGEVVRLEDRNDDAGLSWGQAFQLAQLNIEKLKLERSEPTNAFGPLNDILMPLLTSLLERGANPPSDTQSFEMFKYMKESRMKDEALTMAKNALPELIAMGKDAAEATRQLIQQRGHTIPGPAENRPETPFATVCQGCLLEQTVAGMAAFECAGCQRANNPDGSEFKPQPPDPEPMEMPEPTVTIRPSTPGERLTAGVEQQPVDDLDPLHDVAVLVESNNAGA